MITGIIGAERQEIDIFLATMEKIQQHRIASADFYEGELGGSAVVVACCGIGKVNAAFCTQILISTFRVGRVINTGVAGGLAENLKIFDMVVATETVEHDMDATFFGYEPGQVPGTARVCIPADGGLREAALKSWELFGAEIASATDSGHQHNLVSGRVASGDVFVSEAARRDLIIRNFAPACVEMEGAAVAHVCAANEIPFVILRSISDLAGSAAHISYEEFSPRAARISATLVTGMMEVLK